MDPVIPYPFDRMKMSCGECVTVPCYEDTPEVVMGHLVQQHEYTTADAENAVSEWMNGFETDERGIPFVDYCLYHGGVRYGEVCHGCERIDAQIEKADEYRDEYRERAGQGGPPSAA